MLEQRRERRRERPRWRCKAVVRLEGDVCSSAWSGAPSLCQPWRSRGPHQACLCPCRCQRPLGQRGSRHRRPPAQHQRGVGEQRGHPGVRGQRQVREHLRSSQWGSLSFPEKDKLFCFPFFCIINLEMEAGCLLFRATL